MTLHEIKQESQNNSILTALTQAIPKSNWNNDIVKPYSTMKLEFCEHNDDTDTTRKSYCFA